MRKVRKICCNYYQKQVIIIIIQNNSYVQGLIYKR
jgi:hypothetical protein